MIEDEKREQLPANLVIGEVSGEKVAHNLMHFVRMLRSLGFRAGPNVAVEAAQALGMVGVSKRVDFYWTLHSLLVEKEEQRPLFKQAFRLFWRHVDPLVDDLDILSSMEGVRTPDKKAQVSRRVDEKWSLHNPLPKPPTEIDVDHAGTANRAEVLGKKDFEQMSGEEWDQARRVACALVQGLKPRRTRRYDRSTTGEIDIRATVREAMRTGGELTGLGRRKRRMRPPPLVAICDISGSMSVYSRMFLHFMHGLNTAGTKTHRFVFGTRLSCIDRCMRHGDPDVAIELAGEQVRDWSGGTRIADAMKEFNRDWARRTLSQGAVVLLATDGLERGEQDTVEQLEFEIERLSKSCSSLIWLNPLFRHQGYEALARGAQVINRHASYATSIHSLESLAALGTTLAHGRPASNAIH